jgi:hypothetical protein
MEPFRPAFIHSYDIEITQGMDFVMGFRAMPRTDLGSLYLEDTTGYTATMMVRDGGPDGDLVLEASTTDGRIQVGFTPTAWEAVTAYGVGQKVVPTELNGFVYEATVAGTSDAGEPTWPLVIGDTVVDDGVTWRAETTDAEVSNIYIIIAASVTAALTDWGYGSWTLEVVDSFGNSWLYVDGIARLRLTSVYA